MLFLLLGISMLTVAPRGDVGDRVLGAFSLLLGLAVFGSAVTNDMVLLPDGVAYRYNFRRKHIAWDDVASLGIAPMRMGALSNIVVELRPAGRVRIESIVGTRAYLKRVVSEFEEFRARLEPVSGGGDGG